MTGRLYVSDMDGTLLDPDARLSNATRAGLHRLLDAGVPFTVATARSPQSIAHILEGVPLRLPVVALHGAILSDLATRRHVRIREVSRNAAETMLRIARDRGTSAWLSTHDGERDHVSTDAITNGGSQWYDEELLTNRDPRRRHLEDVTECLEEQIVCFTVMDTEEAILEMAAEYERELAGAITLHAFENAYSPGWWWINAHTAAAGKDQGVRDLVEHTGLHDHEIVSFGDTGSDLHLFEASHRRVAVENAIPEVRAAACETIGHHESDSVIRWILRDAGLES
jgi:Cof subfamily protein (haloacid dehalogenase superfamily)